MSIEYKIGLLNDDLRTCPDLIYHVDSLYAPEQKCSQCYMKVLLLHYDVQVFLGTLFGHLLYSMEADNGEA